MVLDANFVLGVGLVEVLLELVEHENVALLVRAIVVCVNLQALVRKVDFLLFIGEIILCRRGS